MENMSVGVNYVSQENTEDTRRLRYLGQRRWLYWEFYSTISRTQRFQVFCLRLWFASNVYSCSLCFLELSLFADSSKCRKVSDYTFLFGRDCYSDCGELWLQHILAWTRAGYLASVSFFFLSDEIVLAWMRPFRDKGHNSGSYILRKAEKGASST